MTKRNGKIRFYRAMTLLEMVLAMVMITIIFAAVLPQFAAIRNSWDSKQGSSEALQNGRVLMDHISRNLSKAKRITVVSASTVTNGYIQFVDNNDVNNRYDISSANSYVEYGPVGTLSDLAGPVSSLKFTCYDVCNLDAPLSPITDTNIIRTVKVDATITNSASMGQAKTFTTWAYLRTNSVAGTDSSWQTTYDYATRTQGTNIFAYQGDSSGGTTPPSDASTPSDTSVFNSSEYDKIEVDDGSFQMYPASQSGRYALMRFKILIDESKSTVTNVVVTWNGKGVNAKSTSTDGAILYIWDYASSSYQQLQASANTEAEVTLTGTISSNVPNYIGDTGQNTITIAVSTTDKRSGSNACELYTDYIKVVVFAQTRGVYP